MCDYSEKKDFREERKNAIYLLSFVAVELQTKK